MVFGEFDPAGLTHCVQKHPPSLYISTHKKFFVYQNRRAHLA